MNDLINSTLSWIIDSIMIVIGFTGVPSNILDGFLNDAFLAFQMLQHYGRRDTAGPYHPAIERFTATGSAPYNVEALFQFIIALWDSRGYTSAIVTFDASAAGPLRLGKDIFKGMLVPVLYMQRTRMLIDYVELIHWTYSPTERKITAQVGDGKAEEAPIARHSRNITGLQESFNVISMAPQ